MAEAVRNGVGLLEDWHSLEADSLLASVQEVLDNPKYKEAVTRMSDLIMDTPQHPLDRSTFINYFTFNFVFQVGVVAGVPASTSAQHGDEKSRSEAALVQILPP